MAHKWEDTPFKGDLARARGVGAAHSGVHHWMMQKVTAVANLFLMVWAVFAVVTLTQSGAGYAAITEFFAAPLNAIAMILFLISTLYHAVLGLQVVVEDYVHCEASKTIFLILLKLSAVALGVAGIFSILKMAL